MKRITTAKNLAKKLNDLNSSKASIILKKLKEEQFGPKCQWFCTGHNQPKH